MSDKIYTDSEYMDGLRDGNPDITYSFLYKLCRFTITDIMWTLMRGRIQYDELANELYVYLSANSWRKLDTFEGKNGCKLKSWTAKLAWHFFLQQREQLLSVTAAPDMADAEIKEKSDDLLAIEIAVDVEMTFARMPNKRYVQLLRWMLIDGYDADEVAALLHTSPANVYNIKHRAIVQFVQTYK